MIKSLNIQNYQSHKDSSLNFDKGCNVIIGNSDAGKTAILRALRWLITNRPSGDSFRSSWGGKTEVEIFTDDAHIVRSKDKENEYILGDSHFKAFATDVPKEIQDALNISEINISSQLDPPFLLSNTSGEVAQHFNKVAHLEQIDIANSNINSAIRALEQEMKFKTAEAEKQEEQLKTFDYLDKMEADVEVLEELDKQLDIFFKRYAQLGNLKEKIIDNKAELKEYEPLLLLEKDVESIFALRVKRKESLDKNLLLESLLERFEENNRRLIQYNKLIKLEPDVTAIIDNMKKQDELEMKLGDLASDVNDFLSIDSRIFGAETLIKVLEEEFKREIGTICPLCNQPIKHK